MTKKHFIALAEFITAHNRIKDDHSEAANEARANGLTDFNGDHLETLADFCASQNPRFNRERWLGYIAGTNGANGGTVTPPCKPRVITPERKLARRLEGRCAHGKLRHCEVE